MFEDQYEPRTRPATSLELVIAILVGALCAVGLVLLSWITP
jgi:capsular polysaccharide biosynthesis protein